MDAEFKELISEVIKAHPGPWKQKDGYADNGGQFTSIVDAKYVDIIDGESGHISEPVFNLLLNFPEIAAELGIPSDNEQDASK